MSTSRRGPLCHALTYLNTRFGMIYSAAMHVIVWLTGLPGSGKSTLATLLHKHLSNLGLTAARLDGDELRRGLCSDLGFGREDRAENTRRAAEAAVLLAADREVCVVSIISPYLADRTRARAVAESRGVAFMEVFVDASPEVCEARDPKGLYGLARAGLLSELTGLSAPYERPLRPDVHLRSDLDGPDQCVAQLVASTILIVNSGGPSGHVGAASTGTAGSS